MRLDGGGAGFDHPLGDPGPIAAAAASLHAAAGELRAAAGQVNQEGMALRRSWSGPAAAAFEDAVLSVQSGLDALAGHHEDAAGALTTYAAALREAQAAAERAALAYSGAQQTYNTNVTDLAGQTAKGAAAQAAQSRAEGRALDQLTAAYGSASTACSQACESATLAAQVCAARVVQVAADIRETALHRFLDLMGGPSTVLGSLGVVLQGKSLLAFGSLVRAMNTGNWDVVDAADPKGYQEVLDIVEKYGPNSSEATNAWMKYESDVARDAFSDTVKTAIPTGDVPGGMAGVLDVIGKIGFVASIAGDAMTLADGQSTGLEQAMAGVNLGGVVMAAGGITVDAATGTTVLMSLGVADAAATVVPIVGEVVIAATAAYFAYDWTSTHWQDVVNWSHDAAKGLSTAYHAVVNFGGGAVHEGGHLLQSGWHDVGSLAGDLGL